MSSGHRHQYNLSQRELGKLLDQVLADRRVKAALARPYKLNVSKDIPLLGSSDIGWTTVFLDRHFRTRPGWPIGRLVVDGKELNTVPALIRHERLEPILENVFGWKYGELAHPVAQHWEERDYRAKGFDPAAVEKAFSPFIRKIEREPLSNVPTALDLRPMLLDEKMLARTREAQDRQKISQAAVGYVATSDKPKQRCGLCAMFVAGQYGGPACTAVKSPVVADGWCRRFYRGALDKGRGPA